MAFIDWSNELLGYIPELGILMAQRLVNRGWRDIREARLWSWLQTEGVFIAPNLITTGLVTVTQFSNTVNLSAAANAALNNLQNPIITMRQFRGPGSNGGVYNITAYDSVGMTLTLDRIYQEQSVTGGSYQVYCCYLPPQDMNGNLITDFLTFKVAKNPDLGYTITQRSLRYTQMEINMLDPYRADQGYAFFVAPYKYSQTLNCMLWEMWPHPVYQSGYTFLCQRRGLPFVNPTDDVPSTFLSDIIVERARYYCCLWAAQNVGRFPQLKNVNWLANAAEINKNYKEMLVDAVRQDDEMTTDSFIPEETWNTGIWDEDLQVSTLLSFQSPSTWRGN